MFLPTDFIIYLLLVFVGGFFWFFLWYRLSWDYCAAELNELLCNCLILFASAARRHQCQSRQDRIVWNFCHHGPFHTFLNSLKCKNPPRDVSVVTSISLYAYEHKNRELGMGADIILP